MAFKTLLVVFSLFAAIHAQQDSIGCFKEGQCDGNIVANHITYDLEQCASDCDANRECSFFTYYGDSGICSQYETCELLDSGCSDCISGDDGCQLECYEEGFCEGHNVGVSVSSTYDDCMDFCASVSTCEYWTLDLHDNLCTLTESCDPVDVTNCQDCVHGMAVCRYVPHPTMTPTTTEAASTTFKTTNPTDETTTTRSTTTTGTTTPPFKG